MSGDSYSPEATIKTELEEAAVLEDQLPAPDDDALLQSGQEASLQGAASLSTKPRIKSTLLAKLACRQRVYTPGFSVAMNGSLLTSLQPDRSLLTVLGNSNKMTILDQEINFSRFSRLT